MSNTNKLIAGITAVFVLFLTIASIVSIYNEGAFFIPGLAPLGFTDGQPVPLFVNKVTSSKAILPFRYHDLPVCQPPGAISAKHENLGEVLTGNRIELSSYQLEFKKSTSCNVLCSRILSKSDVVKYRDLISDGYLAHWQVDGLPAAMKGLSEKTRTEVWETGFFLGSWEDKGPKSKAALNNHVNITIYYHPHKFGPQEDDKVPRYNVVLFEIQPWSVEYPAGKDNTAGVKSACEASKSGGSKPLFLNEGQENIDVTWTYSITWREDMTTDWAHRWHKYISLPGEGQIHWFSIVNSIMIVFFLSGMVAMILARTVRRDFAQYLDEGKDEVEETGWKLVNGDVFRPPERKTAFSVLIGSGIQVFWMSVVTMVFAVLGFLAPSNQGAIITAVLVMYVWMGIAAGYSSSRVYQMFDGDRPTFNTLITAVAFPGTIFGIAFFLNFFLWARHSSGAFPFTSMLAVMALWFFVSVPLCYLGSRLALRRPPSTHPGNVNLIPRPIPAQKWYMHFLFSTLMGGVLPFGAVFIELYFILTSIWQHSYYVLFGFLFLVFLILIITCAEISVVMVYFQLCSEDWQWWWRSFMTSGSSALYMFLYSIFYFSTRLEVHGFVSGLLYFGYTLILCLFFFVLTGTIGFYASYYFVRAIYGAIHQD